ncbi:LysR substrate-binding domain-containing protein [Mesorhizobium sp. M0244]|uniref:LysR substrate-binding domain-containing protein n=1 Tax=Mesorhizobium sp. M0244 TaxID=2956926 RepID=UPI00333BBDC8
MKPGTLKKLAVIHQIGVSGLSACTCLPVTRLCTTAGIVLEDPDNHLFFNRSHLCIDAALRGLRIAIGDYLSCGEHLRSGRLVQLPGPVLLGRDQYHLLTPDTVNLSRPARQTRDWLRKAADK